MESSATAVFAEKIMNTKMTKTRCFTIPYRPFYWESNQISLPAIVDELSKNSTPRFLWHLPRQRIPQTARLSSRGCSPPLDSQAASLPWGGLYDTKQNWLPQHCGHRDGKTLDISLSKTSDQQKTAIQDAANLSGLQFNYIAESPTCTQNPYVCKGGNPDHWHATLVPSGL